MKKTVKFLMSISLCMCMMMSLFSFNSYASDNDNVKLYYAHTKRERVGGSWYDSWSTVGKIAVKDLGDDAKVYIHYDDSGSGEWHDLPATYLKKSSDGYNVYTFETDKIQWAGYYFEYKCNFAIKYEVNGQTYWDNNNGQDYFVGWSANRPYNNIILNKSKLLFTDRECFNYNVIGGYIVINDHPDNVTVKYRTNDNDAYKEAKVYISPSQSSVNSYEKWAFECNVENANKCEFYIEYEKDGHTYTDDNFGDNYTI